MFFVLIFDNSIKYSYNSFCKFFYIIFLSRLLYRLWIPFGFFQLIQSSSYIALIFEENAIAAINSFKKPTFIYYSYRFARSMTLYSYQTEVFVNISSYRSSTGRIKIQKFFVINASKKLYIFTVFS